MRADIDEIAETLRAVARGEIPLGEAQARAARWPGGPPEEPARVDDLNAEARRTLEAARALYDSLVDRV